MHHTSISCRMQCTAIFSNEPTELITGYNSVFGAYNSLQDWVTTHVVKANLFRSTMNLWIFVLKLKCLSRTHSDSFSQCLCTKFGKVLFYLRPLCKAQFFVFPILGVQSSGLFSSASLLWIGNHLGKTLCRLVIGTQQVGLQKNHENRAQGSDFLKASCKTGAFIHMLPKQRQLKSNSLTHPIFDVAH